MSRRWTPGFSNPFRDLPREVAVLSAVGFAVAVGFGIVAPAIPLFATEFGVGHAAAGAVISAFAAMRFISALGAGRLVDLFGERLLLAIGIGIVAVSSALAGFAQSYWQLLVLRGAGGIGSAMFSVAGASLLLRVVPGDRRGQAQGIYAGSFLVGGITGPLFGALVIGFSLRMPFFLYAGTLLVAGAIGLAALARTPLAERQAETRVQVTSLASALRNRAYIAACLTNLADQWAVLGVRAAIIPLFVEQALHEPTEWVGIGFAIVAATNAGMLLFAGRYADRRGRKPVLVAGCIILAVALTGLAFWETLAGYLVAMVLIGLGSGLLNVAPAAIVGDVMAGRGGTVVATYQMAGDFGSIVGPVAAGALVDQLSYGAAFGSAAAVIGAAAIVGASAPETRQRVPSAADRATLPS